MIGLSMQFRKDFTAASSNSAIQCQFLLYYNTIFSHLDFNATKMLIFDGKSPTDRLTNN